MNSPANRALQAILLSITAMASAEEATVKPDPAKEADKQISRLDSTDFDERESALKKLMDMDPVVLPYLKGLVEGKRSLNEEVRGRLGMVINALEAKRASVETSKGTPVALHLSKAGPKEILQELAKQAHAEPLPDFEARLPSEPAADFTFTGSYWEAIDELLRLFPPKDNGKWTREDLNEARSLSFWTAADYDAWAMPHAIAGACRIRAGRVALERNAKGQAITVVLVPQVEPRYQVEKIEVQVDTFTLQKGKTLKPQWVFQARPNINVNPFMARMARESLADNLVSPQSECLFTAPAADLLNGDRQMSVEGSIIMSLREVDVLVKTMREVASPINLPGGYTFSARTTRDGIDVQFSGGGNMNETLPQIRNRVQFLDANNNPLETQITQTSMQGTAQGFTFSEKQKVTGNPVKVRISLPGKPLDVSMPFTIKNVALPVAGEK